MKAKERIMVFASVLLLTCSSAVSQYKAIKVEAPFPLDSIKEYIFPGKSFSIVDYGAIEGGKTINTKAISETIHACHQAGGGQVVIPAGEWLTGPIHLKSNVNLYLSENAVVRFTDNPQDYLPAVMTSWEGMECYNYSPLVYAFECENIAITGKGMLKPHMDKWKEWFARPKSHMDALAALYHQFSGNVPVEERQMAVGENNLRPHLIHFNRCKNVLLDGFMIRESPFWTIHIYMCDGGIVRNLDVKANGHNNDGIDLEMSRNFLVEDCLFDQGDDAVVIKAGRNQDAWRLNTPSENIVVRNCKVLAGHTLLGIGSELSGGIRNIYMHDCTAPGSFHQIVFIKTNHRRGGYVENIYVKNITGGEMKSMFGIETDVLYQWRNLVPTYEKRLTKIEGVFLEGIHCKKAENIYEINGDAGLPVRNVRIRDVTIDTITDFPGKASNAESVTEKNINYKLVKNSGRRDIWQ